MNKIVGHLVKFGVSAAIIAFLVREIVVNESFVKLRQHATQQPLGWWMLAAACGISVAAVSITFVRWYFLVRALDLPFSLKDAFRLGSLGYMFNLVLIGSVGGDLVKAVLAAREQAGRRTEAVASVLMDRIVGMYSLIVLAAAGILLTGIHNQLHAVELQRVFRAALVAAALGTLGAMLIFVPGVTGRRMTELCGRVPWIGGILQSLLGAARAYRTKWKVLALALALSLCSNSLFTLTLYAVAEGLPGNHPTLTEHFAIIPLGSATGLIPLPLGALGLFEGVLKYLYSALVGVEQVPDKGLIVALAYRVVTIVVAIFGAAYYVSSRREVAAAMRAARELAAAKPGA